MLNQSFKIIVIFVILGFVLPNFSLAQEPQLGARMPQTVGEVKGFATEILTKLPDAVKRIWEGEAMPVWKKMWEEFLKFWDNVLGPIIDPWRQKLLNLLSREAEKRRPAIEEEIKKEKEEIKEDLWQRFKELLNDKL